MTEARVDITAQSGQAETAWQRYAREVLAVLEIDRQRAAEDRKASQAAAELGRIKTRVLASIETATDRYAKRVDELQKLDHKGILSAEEFARAMKHAKEELEASNPAAAEAAQKQRELARAVQQTTEQTRTPMERYRAAIERLNQLKAAGLSNDAYNRALRTEREQLIANSGRLDERRQKQQALKQQEAELARLRESTLQTIATPQEKFNRQLAVLNTLRQQNRLTEEQYSRAVRKSKQDLEDTSRSGVSGLESMASKVAGVAAGYLSIQGGLQWWFNANKDLLEQANQLGFKYDTALRKFRALTGLNQLQGKEAQKKILAQALEGGNTAEEASVIANALASTGMGAEQIQSGGVRSMTKLLNAQAAAGKAEDSGRMTEAVMQYLESQGLEKSAKNIDMVSGKIQGLKETPMKVTDLEFLAKEGAALRGKLTIDEQLATFGQLRGIEQGSEAATDLRNIAVRLSTAKGDKDKVTALRRLKLKPEDVDLLGEGENLTQATSLIDERLKTIPEAERESILKKLFEEKSLAAFHQIVNERGARERLTREMNREGLIEQDAAVMESGLDAKSRRVTLRNELAKLKRDDQGGTFRDEIETQNLDDGRSPASTYAAMAVYDISRFLGAGQDTGLAVSSALADWRTILGPVGLGMRSLGIGGESLDQTRQRGVRTKQAFRDAGGPEERVEKLIDALDRNTKATEQNSAKPAAPTVRNNNAPPAKRPSQQLAEVN